MDQPLSYVQFDDWTLEFKELAEWFGMELSRIIVQYRVFGGLASTFGGIVTLICLATFS